MNRAACKLWTLTAFCALFFSTQALAQNSGPLGDSDFVVAGVKVGADSVRSASARSTDER
jgi:hypothetical protein